jgi:hypothetical protein
MVVNVTTIDAPGFVGRAGLTRRSVWLGLIAAFVLAAVVALWPYEVSKECKMRSRRNARAALSVLGLVRDLMRNAATSFLDSVAPVVRFVFGFPMSCTFAARRKGRLAGGTRMTLTGAGC